MATATRLFSEEDIARIREANPSLFADTAPRTTVAHLPPDLAARLPVNGLETVLARVYVTDTPTHVDTDASRRHSFAEAYLVYLTSNPGGELYIGDDIVHSLEVPGQLFTIPAGVPHGTRGTAGTVRVSLGPFNDAGRPVGVPFESGFTYYDVDQTTILTQVPYPLDTVYTIQDFTAVGGVVPSGKRFLGWSMNMNGSGISYATDDSVKLQVDTNFINFFPVFVTPPSSGSSQTILPTNAILSTANAMVNESAETTAVGGMALVRARRANPAMRFPDYASYLKYQQGVTRVQIRRATAPQRYTMGATVPSPPTIDSIMIADNKQTYNNGSMIISFQAPSNSGGSPILYYSVRAYTSVSGPDILYNIQFSQANENLPFIGISPLSVNIPYTIRMTATNAVGTSEWSAFSDPFVIPGVPTEPQNVTVTPGDGQVTVEFAAPANDGGFPILYYLVKTFIQISNILVEPDVSGSLPSITVTGLDNDTTYYCNIIAVNTNGNGALATTDPFTPFSSP